MPEPWYVIAQLDVPDLARYRAEYAAHVVPLIHRHGGELLVTSADAEAREGTWPGTWTVVFRFPTREHAVAWYEDPDYAPLKQARLESLSRGGNVVFVPGREPAR